MPKARQLHKDVSFVSQFWSARLRPASGMSAVFHAGRHGKRKCIHMFRVLGASPCDLILTISLPLKTTIRLTFYPPSLCSGIKFLNHTWGLVLDHIQIIVISQASHLSRLPRSTNRPSGLCKLHFSLCCADTAPFWSCLLGDLPW